MMGGPARVVEPENPDQLRWAKQLGNAQCEADPLCL